MHRVLLISLVPAFLGCLGLFSGDPDRFYCDAYLDCIADAEPSLFAQTDAAYGDDGACWGNGSDEECEQACQSALDAMAALHPSEPACDEGLVNPGGSDGGTLRPLSGEYTITFAATTDPRCFYEAYTEETWRIGIDPSAMRIDADIYPQTLQCSLDDTQGFRCPEAIGPFEMDHMTDIEFRDTFEGSWTTTSTFQGRVKVEIFCYGDCEYHDLDTYCSTEFPFTGARR